MSCGGSYIQLHVPLCHTALGRGTFKYAASYVDLVCHILGSSRCQKPPLTLSARTAVIFLLFLSCAATFARFAICYYAPENEMLTWDYLKFIIGKQPRTSHIKRFINCACSTVCKNLTHNVYGKSTGNQFYKMMRKTYPKEKACGIFWPLLRTNIFDYHRTLSHPA